MVDLPVKLTVSFMILMLMVPAIGMLVDDVDRESSLSGLRSEARSVSDCMSRAYYSGEGSFASVRYDIEYGKSLRIGGDGPDGMSIRLCVDGDIREVMYLDNPPVVLTGGEMEISGSGRIMFRSVSIDGSQYLEVVR